MSALAMSDSAAGSPPPGEATACPSRRRPVDLVHLSHQTLGDRTLEREILGLMHRQILAFGERLHRAGDADRCHIAHALKGAARNIGAFALAEAAEELEKAPGSAPARGALEAEMQRAAAFIASLDS